jgi:hypothetical protein
MENTELRQLVEAIVRAVLNALNAQALPAQALSASRGGKPAEAEVLALFTGGRVHFDLVTQNLNRVTRAGHRIDGVLSRGAKWVFGEAADAATLGVSRLLAEEYPESYEALVRPYKAVVLPTLSRTTGAKLVWGICDTMVTNAVYSALALNLAVIAVNDSMTGEDEEACRECGNSIPYVRALNADYFGRLEKLGVRVTAAQDLADELLGILGGGSSAVDAYRELVTEHDIRHIHEGEIKITPGTIVTPLARDHLRAHNIRVRVVQEPGS